MRIVFTVDSMNSGGAERVVSQLANFFDKEGYSVTIIMVSYNQKKTYYSLNDSVQLIPLVEGHAKKTNPFYRIKKLNKVIKEIKPDVVIAFLSHICIYTYFALKGTHIPFVCSERYDPNQYSFFIQILLKHIFKKADFCVFQTHAALHFYFKKENSKTAIIYNPVSSLILKADINNKHDEKTIITVGRLEKQKNHKLLIDAFRTFHLTHNDYVLKIYGDGSLKKDLELYIQSNDLENSIFLMGISSTWLTDERESSLFVLPSDYEGLSNSLLEALAAGIPCISTDCPIGGSAEIIDDGINGILVPVQDKEALVKAIEDIIDKRIILKRNNKVDNMDINIIGNKWLSMIKTIVKKR